MRLFLSLFILSSKSDSFIINNNIFKIIFYQDKMYKIIMKEPSEKRTQKLHDCKYWRKKDGYISGCGYRMAYNRFWHVCPICRKSIVVINQKALDGSEE